MIYIYSHSVTNRLEYTLDIVFKTILQVEYQLVDKETFSLELVNPKINYSDEELPNSIWIKPHSLLFESNIHPQDIQVTYQKEIPYFFKIADMGLFQFDLFASSFYMLSRYEEYLPFVADEHGRFTAKESLAFKANFLQKPVVHLWARQLRDAILDIHPDFLFPTRIFTQINTIDIDIAFSYKGKSFKRRFGGLIRAMLHFNIKEVFQHFSFMFTRKDPYDTYAVLKEIQEYSNAKSIYFFQVGKHGINDKNLPINKVMRKLINVVADYVDVGIHPSYQSNEAVEILKKEHKDLSEVISEPITKSRQHYLKMKLPETYENLISIGIEEDYTMGFPDQIGFRTGMTIAYPFFNLRTNQQRPLSIVPFQIMDGTLKDYLRLSSDEAILKIQEIKETIQEVNGQLVSIFHNSSLANKGEWKGWLAAYREVLG